MAFTNSAIIPENLLPETSPYESMPDIDISLEGIVNMLEKLKVGKAPGPDGIPALVLHKLLANVVPIYKKGDKTDPGNNRPISLACIICKMMEHILTSNIMSHASRNNILYLLQHGFQAKKSCELQLTGFVTDLLNNMEENEQTDIVITDFSQTFYKVGHQSCPTTKKTQCMHNGRDEINAVLCLFVFCYFCRVLKNTETFKNNFVVLSYAIPSCLPIESVIFQTLLRKMQLLRRHIHYFEQFPHGRKQYLQRP